MLNFQNNLFIFFMSEMKLTRLNKVLREFNISLDRAVEFLASSGHIIEARPTTKISESQYNLFLDEFSSDKSSKVESHDLSEEKKKQKEELRIKLEKEQEEKIKKQNELIKAKAEVKKPVLIEKIDLDQFKKTKPPLKKEIIKVEETLKENEKVKEVLEKIEPVKDKKEDSNIKTKYTKLSGLKTVGDKIDLEQFKKSKPTSAVNKISAASKRKRSPPTKRMKSNNPNPPPNSLPKTNPLPDLTMRANHSTRHCVN